MRTSEFCYKTAGTCLVILLALCMVVWLGHFPELWMLIKGLAIIGGAALVIGIVIEIWD